MSQGHNVITGVGTNASDSVLPSELGKEGDSKLKLLVEITHAVVQSVLDGNGEFSPEEKEIIKNKRADIEDSCSGRLSGFFMNELKTKPYDLVEGEIKKSIRRILKWILRSEEQ